MRRMEKVLLLFLTVACAAALHSCGGGGGDSGSSDSSTDDGQTTETSVTEAFPSTLAVSSPFDVVSQSASLKSAKALTSGYSSITSKINTVLSGSSASVCTFDPQSFLSKPSRAECYGPTINYENHPDGTLPNSGQLPSGDLGIWKETESTGEACAAAELNAQMEGVSFQTEAAMTSVASMVCTANVNGAWPPAAGSSIDLTTLATPISATNVTFSKATISLDSAGEVWLYDLAFVYTDTSSVSHSIAVQLSHDSTSTGGTGRFTYYADDTFSGGNCPTSDVTLNGSLVYSVSGTDVDLQSRIGYFCGRGSVGIGSDGLVDPMYTYTSYSKGWANNFSVFTANFDSSTLAGQYSYRWQAGPGDSNTRVFNIGVNSTTPLTGEAWFGFGDQIWTSDECINGFYCSWAGPGNTHAISKYAQRQNVTLNTVTGLVEPTNSAASDIIYAPTNACTYDGSGTFRYDRDLDGDYTDETAATNVVTATLTTGLVLDLYAAQDTNGDGTATMCETIQSRGITQPVAPSYSNAYTGSTHP
ncbi:MAG: hypothetical protein HY954_02040 [Deltaproteobacteria bacterium]|nr:hypothetical protein [Deltaproteobacteria bacterium]